MRVLTTTTLSAFLIAVAPVLVDHGVTADSTPQIVTRETVIAKTTPDGTWPLSGRPSASRKVSSSWI